GVGEEQVDDRHGVERAMAPGVPDVAAGVEDLGAIELSSRGVLEVTKDRKDPLAHGGLPASGGLPLPPVRQGAAFCSSHCGDEIWGDSLNDIPVSDRFGSEIRAALPTTGRDA